MCVCVYVVWVCVWCERAGVVDDSTLSALMVMSAVTG